MKFKKVNIQAFRVYNKVEDGTFDFNTDDNKNVIADFISIYAPNGFGKTSFYDAIEYGFTESIGRFLKTSKLNKDAAKSERAIMSSKTGQSILRNKFATDDLATEIKIYTTASEKPIETKFTKNTRKGSTDYDFDEKNIKNKYFQSVILSQEWIDAFLKVDDPFDRYTKFIEYFGDSKINDYYRKLVELLTLNDSRIEELKRRLEGVQKELDFNGDKDILRKVNDKIVELKSLNETLDVITDLYTEIDSLNLSNKISERLSDLEFGKNKQSERIRYIDVVFAGSDQNSGLKSYFESKTKYTQLSEKEVELKRMIDCFAQLKNKTIESENINKEIKKSIEERQVLEDIIKLFSEFVTLSGKLFQLEKDAEVLQKEHQDYNNSIALLRFKQGEEQGKIASLTSQISSLEREINELPKLREKHAKDIADSIATEISLQLTEDNLKSLTQAVASIEGEMSNISKAISGLNQNEFPSIFEKEFSPHEVILKRLESTAANLGGKNQDLKNLNTTIKDQEQYNKDIELFITKGAEIIGKNQASSCPLCNQEYESFQVLSERVASNKQLSKLLSRLLIDRATLEKQISDLTQSLTKDKDSLKQILEKDAEGRQKEIFTLKNDLKSQEDNKQVALNSQKRLQEGIQSYLLILKGRSPEQYEKEIENSLITLRKSLFDSSEILDRLSKEDHETNQQFVISVAKLEFLQQEVQEIRKNRVYQKIINYFNIHFLDREINGELLNNKLHQLNDTININKTTEDAVQKQIVELTGFIKDTTEELLQTQINLSVQTKDALRKAIIGFEQELKSSLGMNVENFQENDLSEQLNKMREESKLKVVDAENRIKDYSLLSELKTNVEPYLKYEIAKKTESELKDKFSFLSEKVKITLNEEKERVSAHLNAQINSFFYEDLINDLYRRIDPHPDYKKIKFICDFKDDKPKLNVCLYSNDNFDDPIIPNLYFSTAQLNILSLSIFLAKALNAKDDKGNQIDCIFIDDPIQSMDSINILSTIDLFRSLVVNNQKQIILSTHDENFHNLLKKKMPSNLFKSKFMELETFGKVKPDA